MWANSNSHRMTPRRGCRFDIRRIRWRGEVLFDLGSECRTKLPPRSKARASCESTLQARLEMCGGGAVDDSLYSRWDSGSLVGGGKCHSSRSYMHSAVICDLRSLRMARSSYALSAISAVEDIDNSP